jgi:1,4-dihydroxy-2-naphthoyl-CoA hydrolase
MGLRPGITLEIANARSKGRLPELMGFRVTHVEDGRVDAEIDIRPEILAPNGYLHAATVVALADTACGYGCLMHLPDNMANFTTIELKSNFIGTARDGTIAAIARPVHQGATTQVWDATVRRKADDRTIALFRCTQMLLPPR